MDLGDLVFYGIIAISVVSSVAKALKKQPGEGANTGMPDFKGSKPGEIFRRVIEDLEKEDDYLPSNPRSAKPSVQKKPTPMQKFEPMKSPDLASVYNKSRHATENMPRREAFASEKEPLSSEVREETDVPALDKLDLSQSDELRKAIIYSEILRPKF